MHPRRLLVLAASLLAALTVAVLAPVDARAQQAPLPPGLTALDAPEGRRLLVTSDANADFFRLANHWVSQQHGAYCGVASAVMVLNAMQLAAPAVPAWAPYNTFTQDNVFDPATLRVLSPGSVTRGGMSIDQLGQLLASHGAGARVVHASDATLDMFRGQASENLAEPGNYVLVNYDRAGVGQETMGHISPLGAYNAAADRFLIMDVARYKYPGVWVAAVDLWRAMRTTDPSTDRSRGYVLISSTPGSRPVVGPPARTRLPRFVLVVLAGTFAGGFLLGALVTALWARRSRRRAARVNPT
ncbi:MAG: phytochelatin synthase family protein [Deltaproteobacteria bacterium]